MFETLRKKKRKLAIKNKTIKLVSNELSGDCVELKLLLLAHALEKGMGMPVPRSGFGYEKAEELLMTLEEYKHAGCDCSSYAFVEGVSVLEAYYSYTDNDVEKFQERFRMVSNGVELNPAGRNEIVDVGEIYGNLNFDQINYFITSRHSIRSYEPKQVDDELIHNVLKMASKYPSACNRQPIKVYVSTNSDTVSKVNQLIPGNKGFENEVPNWAIVSVDRNMFNEWEPMQWYVNGGIYLSYLVQAMHAYHLGSCIFQMPMIHPYTSKLREIASIPDNESIVAAVGFGYPKKANKFLVASRKSVNEVLIKF